MKQKLFFIEAILLTVYVCQLLSRYSNAISSAIVIVLLVASLRKEKARLYTPLIIAGIFLNTMRMAFGITSWISFILEVTLMLISIVLALVIRVFEIPHRYALHELKFKESMSLSGFYSQPLAETPCSVWYPTRSHSNLEVPWVQSDQMFRTLYEIHYVDANQKRWIPFWLFKFCFSYLKTYKIPAHPKTKIIEKKTYKVIIFSHGLGAHSRGYSCYTQWWAKRGHIVISVQHDHDKPCVDFRKFEGDIKTRESQLYEERNKQIRMRRQDISRVFKYVQERGLDSIFGGKIEVESVMFAGHSFGGGSILEAGASLTQEKLYSKVNRYLCLDPWIFPLSKQSYKCLDRPILFINSQKFVRNNPQFYDIHGKNKIFMDLNPKMSKILMRGLQHLHPSDMIFTFGTIFVLTRSISNFGKRMFYVDILAYMIRLFEEDKTGHEIIELTQAEIKEKLAEEKPYLTHDERANWRD